MFNAKTRFFIYSRFKVHVVSPEIHGHANNVYKCMCLANERRHVGRPTTHRVRVLKEHTSSMHKELTPVLNWHGLTYLNCTLYTLVSLAKLRVCTFACQVRPQLTWYTKTSCKSLLTPNREYICFVHVYVQPASKVHLEHKADQKPAQSMSAFYVSNYKAELIYVSVEIARFVLTMST